LHQKSLAASFLPAAVFSGVVFVDAED